jgi:hypothetical protein
LSSEKERIGQLQLVGRLENYLVIEFISHIHLRSQGKRLCLTNLGKRNEQRIDIAVTAGPLDGPIISALIECKYLRNCHRAWPCYNAGDESRPALTCLTRQLGRLTAEKHGDLQVKLTGRNGDIYGLVFASFVLDPAGPRPSNKKKFFDDQLNIARDAFRYHDLPTPAFRSAYEDVEVNILGGTRLVSLRAGLWRLRSISQQR